jgi:hypothetical protein
MICENGAFLAEAERFARGSRSIVADVDIQRLETLRAKEHSFGFEGPVPPYCVQDAGEAAKTDFEASLLRRLEPHPFVPQGDPAELDMRCREILSTQVAGLVTRLEHIHCRKAVIGVSGGLDSTLALLVTALAFDTLGLPRENIIGVTMPGFGTTHRTHDNSVDLMNGLGITAREVSIVPAVRQHFADIGQDESNHDLTYENSLHKHITRQVVALFAHLLTVLDFKILLSRNQDSSNKVLQVKSLDFGFKVFLYLLLLTRDSLDHIPPHLVLFAHLPEKITKLAENAHQDSTYNLSEQSIKRF